MTIVEARQISGGPSWIDSDRFDIEARIDDAAGDLATLYLPNGKGSPGLGYLMVQTLLAERFKLVVHTESRELPVYALVVARRDGRMGPQLRRSDVDCAAYTAALLKNGGRPLAPPQPGEGPPCSFGPGRLAGNAVTMSYFADALSPSVNRPVLDRTGLAGDFDLTLEWMPEFQPVESADAPVAPGAWADSAPSIFTAVQE